MCEETAGLGERQACCVPCLPPPEVQNNKLKIQAKLGLSESPSTGSVTSARICKVS